MPTIQRLVRIIQAFFNSIKPWSTLEWYTRYGARLEDYRLPKDQAKRHALAELIGTDGIALLQAIYAPGASASLRDLPAVELLRRIWGQNYLPTAEGVTWRANDNIPHRSNS